MAVSLVGGSALNAFLSVLFDRIASREVVNYFKGKKLNDKLLEKLKITLRSVNGVLYDAEEKQITKPAVKDWLDDLKSAVYEADDFLDEIVYEAMKIELKAAGSRKQKVRKFFTSLKPSKKESELEAQLEELFERFEFLVKQINVLGLIMKEGVGENPSSHKTPTTSLLDDDFGVYGRDDDKEAITNLLLSSNLDGNETLGVIPIVGLGGIGKTTLAQFVYNDNRVQEWFELKAWICVSEEFNICKVTKDIFEKVNRTSSDTNDLDQLQCGIREMLTGKRFLLVLDDVWNNKYEDWDILRRPLKAGAEGSKIIVTTRDESVALVMGTFGAHRLNELNDDHCWSLFVEHAFDEKDANPHQELEQIGKEVIKKCRGLPLAAKTLGGLLHCKRDVKEWERILKSDLWNLPNNSILPALRLSYHYLPSHLKQCFAYCAIFPKDYEYQKEELVFLWMAEGFLVQGKENRVMDEVGDEYFYDLVSRSLLQQATSRYTSDPCFIMHDLVHDLAKFVSGEFCFRLDGDNSCNIGKRTRHLSYARTGYDTFKKFEGIHEHQVLRTFTVINTNWMGGSIDERVIHDLLPTLKQLRVLSLQRYINMVELPNSINNLKHLRYLNLHRAPIKQLPKSLCNLYYLQTLILRWCKNLVELPSNLWMLVNLCHLDIEGTRLHEMPPQMGKLTKLVKLSDFFVGKQNCSGIEVLRLLHLQGGLRLWNLQNVVDVEDAAMANLKEKEHLKKLELRWDGNTDDCLNERRILEQLQPSANVEGLCIYGYGGPSFPDWVGSSRYSKMVSLQIRGCKYCVSLPPLGQLASLKDLHLEWFEGVITVGSEFYGSGKSIAKSFASLEALRFEDMPRWCEWIPDTGRDKEEESVAPFPLLRDLYISKCPKLTKALPNHLPSLIRLEISGCEQPVLSLPRAPNLGRMTLSDHSRLVHLDKLPSGSLRLMVCELNYPSSLDSLLEEIELMCSLDTISEIRFDHCNIVECFPLESFRKLEVFNIGLCPNLKSFSPTGEPLWDLTFLKSLSIFECPNFVSFPEGGLPAPYLHTLSLSSCSNLESLPECMQSLLPCLTVLEISYCPKIESFPERGLPSNLDVLKIHHCEKLTSSLLQWDLQHLLSLSELTIDLCEHVESFPEETLLPCSLTTLCISNFQNLKTLNYRGLQHLNTLRELSILSCPNLQSMPEGWFPFSLFSLSISDCPLLEERCQREEGEDWDKISHIPIIEINGFEI